MLDWWGGLSVWKGTTAGKKKVALRAVVEVGWCGYIPCFREAGFCDYGPAEEKTAPGRRSYLSRREVTLF